MYMLDTNACIQAVQGAKKDKFAQVTKIFKKKLPLGLSISTITLAELEYGVAHSAYPEKNAIALMNFLAPIEIIPFDAGAALAYGAIREGLRSRSLVIGPYDLLIAAHAKSLGYTLVTNNVREFERVEGLAIEDWLLTQ
jgi:tRNA(fMet)-specific endonuclease VapC